MKACCGFGHRLVLANIEEKLYTEVLKAAKEGFSIFYTGAKGEFDSLFANSVRKVKQTYTTIELICVRANFSNEINANKDYYAAIYDKIIIPSEIENMHYKAIIDARNRWIVDNSDLVISYIVRDFGGAANAVKYAKNKNKRIILLNE